MQELRFNAMLALFEGQLVRLEQEWLTLRAGLREAIGWRWGRFKEHVLQNGGFRLLRAGLPTEPEKLDAVWAAIENCLEPFRRAGRIPPLHFYVRADETPSLEVQASVPLSLGQGSVVLAGDEFCLAPKTILMRGDIDLDWTTASTALQRVEPTDEREEVARQLLLDALDHI